MTLRKPLPSDADDKSSPAAGYSYNPYPAEDSKACGDDVRKRLELHLDWLASNADYYATKPGREGVLNDAFAKIATAYERFEEVKEGSGSLADAVKRAAERAAAVAPVGPADAG